MLQETIRKIQDLDFKAQEETCRRLDSLTKPIGSLGMLEDVAVKIAGITGNSLPEITKKAVIIMAGDHGIVAEGVSPYPQEVTPQMVYNFLEGGAAINVLSRHAKAEVICVDVGVAAELNAPGLLSRKVAHGTKNMALGPAMTLDEARQAIEVGIAVASEKIANGVNLLATGDMGIGNTTPSSAILAVFSGFPVAYLTGKGTGLDEKGFIKKIEVIKKVLEINQPDPRDGLDVLRKVGGLEIAGLAGVILGAAAAGVPVVIDGFISGAAAMIARSIAPKSLNYMIASHLSEEPGHKIMLTWLGLEPMIHVRMRLGEGTGAVLTFHLIEASLKVLREMATFSQAGVSTMSD